MTKKRVFVAIDLPADIKQELAVAIAKIKPLFGPGVRFLSPENWHFTISFLGYQSDNDVSLIADALKETAQNFPSPAIQLERIIYGPIGKTPRMIWLTASKETSEALDRIKKFLEKRLIELNIPFRQEIRPFKAHLTLARFAAPKGRELPLLDVPFPQEFEAESINLMESHLKRSGADYEIMAKYPLDEN